MHVGIILVFKLEFPICVFRPHTSLVCYIPRPSNLPWTTNHEHHRTFYPSSDHLLRFRSKYSPQTADVTPSASILCLGWQNIGLRKHYYRVHSDPGWRSIVWYIPAHKIHMKRTLYRTSPNVTITGTRVLTRHRLARRSHTHAYLRKSHLYTSLNFFTLLTRCLSKKNRRLFGITFQCLALPTVCEIHKQIIRLLSTERLKPTQQKLQGHWGEWGYHSLTAAIQGRPPC
jgi:hypothetical protein